MKTETVLSFTMGIALILTGLGTLIYYFNVDINSSTELVCNNVSTIPVKILSKNNDGLVETSKTVYSGEKVTLKERVTDDLYMIGDNEYVLSKNFDYENETSKQLLYGKIVVYYSTSDKKTNYIESFDIDFRELHYGETWYHVKNSEKYINSKNVKIVDENYRSDKFFLNKK